MQYCTSMSANAQMSVRASLTLRSIHHEATAWAPLPCP
jgi:hypothetical protein